MLRFSILLGHCPCVFLIENWSVWSEGGFPYLFGLWWCNCCGGG